MDFRDEEEDDRFFGDGLTSDQKDILDYVDEINPEEVYFGYLAVLGRTFVPMDLTILFFFFFFNPRVDTVVGDIRSWSCPENDPQI